MENGDRKYRESRKVWGKYGDGCGYLITKKGGMEKERDSFDLAGEK